MFVDITENSDAKTPMNHHANLNHRINQNTGIKHHSSLNFSLLTKEEQSIKPHAQISDEIFRINFHPPTNFHVLSLI